eukprot:scaffold40683_cov39-Cyclotella_meneghiniana.AAC.4
MRLIIESARKITTSTQRVTINFRGRRANVSTYVVDKIKVVDEAAAASFIDDEAAVAVVEKSLSADVLDTTGAASHDPYDN